MVVPTAAVPLAGSFGASARLCAPGGLDFVLQTSLGFAAQSIRETKRERDP